MIATGTIQLRRAIHATRLAYRPTAGHDFNSLVRVAHQPTEHALRRLDVLARQAADLIERSRTEVALRESNEQLRRLASIVECSDDAMSASNITKRFGSAKTGA